MPGKCKVFFVIRLFLSQFVMIAEENYFFHYLNMCTKCLHSFIAAFTTLNKNAFKIQSGKLLLSEMNENPAEKYFFSSVSKLIELQKIKTPG